MYTSKPFFTNNNRHINMTTNNTPTVDKQKVFNPQIHSSRKSLPHFMDGN